jgi:hypothetical protein
MTGGKKIGEAMSRRGHNKKEVMIRSLESRVYS